jgi:dTDP-4-amino-4,6-dideoxygalactose transaminase
LERSWYTNSGPLVEEFEERVATLLGVRHCIAVSNATVGLELVLKAVERAGDVIVPSFTFVATAHAPRWLGLRPIFCDVDPSSHNLDASELAQLVTGQTAAVIAVHLWGRPCDVDGLEAITSRYGIPLLYDAAQAFGCSFGPKRLGNFGAAEIFSFHATKYVTTGEGGAITTNDESLARRLRLLRNFGFAGVDKVVGLGTNAKMSEFAAAVGLTSLDGMADVVAGNQRRYELYREMLADLPWMKVASYDAANHPNYQYVVAEVDAHPDGLTRDDLVRILRAENILARRYFFPGCHRVAPHNESEPPRPLRTTERLTSSVIALPTGLAVPEEALMEVTALIRFCLSHGSAIVGRLRASGEQ